MVVRKIYTIFYLRKNIFYVLANCGCMQKYIQAKAFSEDAYVCIAIRLVLYISLEPHEILRAIDQILRTPSFLPI